MAKKSVQFINLSDKHTFVLTQESQLQTHTKVKKPVIGARLFYQDIITHSFKLEKKYAAQELDLTIELKMYEDLGLDTQKIYKIAYIQKQTNIEDILLIEAFAFDIELIKNKYASTLKTIKHIDFLCIPALTYETLYNRHLIQKSNDVFIYIDEDEAFLTFYKDGAYISSKKIKSLQDMVKELKHKSIHTTPQEIKEILLTKGITKEQYDLREYTLYEYLQTIFEQLFSTVHNLALHGRSIYDFQQLDKIYFSLDGKIIPSLQNSIEPFIESATLHPMDMISIDKNTNLIDLLSSYYIQDNIDEDNYAQNITFFKKKTPFYQTEVGRFTIAVCASATLISIYPLYQQYQFYTLQKDTQVMQERLDKLSSASKILQNQYKNIKKEIDTYTKDQKSINTRFSKLQNVTNTLLSLKSEDTKYTTILLTINDLLQKYNLTLDHAKQSGEHMIDLEIYSKKNRRDTIALFMQALLSRGYKDVHSNEIKLDDDTYKCIVTVQR